MSVSMQVFVPCHQWHIEENHAAQGREQEWVRCGVHRSTFPGDPGFRQRNPSDRPPGYEGDAPSR
jgi:hypothetical protein